MTTTTTNESPILFNAPLSRNTQHNIRSMNRITQQQRSQKRKSLFDRYIISSTEDLMDRLSCFACGTYSTEEAVVDDDCFDAFVEAPIYHQQEQNDVESPQKRAHLQNYFHSYDLDAYSDFSQDNDNNSIVQPRPLGEDDNDLRILKPRPLQPSDSLRLQRSSGIPQTNNHGEGDDSLRDEPAVIRQNPPSVFRKVSSAAHRYPGIPSSDTQTTCSLSLLGPDDDDDDEDLYSQASTELVSHLFRNKGSKNEEDHEAYGYLLRMKKQNYIHSEEHDETHNYAERTRPLYQQATPPLLPEF